MISKLCCQVNVFVRCLVCKGSFCEECWKGDRTHIIRPKQRPIDENWGAMYCPATGFQIEWVSCNLGEVALLGPSEKVDTVCSYKFLGDK